MKKFLNEYVLPIVLWLSRLIKKHWLLIVLWLCLIAIFIVGGMYYEHVRLQTGAVNLLVNLIGGGI